MTAFGNWLEPSSSISERLDWAIGAQDKLDARLQMLIRVLADKGVLDQNDVARIAEAADAPEAKQP